MIAPLVLLPCAPTQSALAACARVSTALKSLTQQLGFSQIVRPKQVPGLGEILSHLLQDMTWTA